MDAEEKDKRKYKERGTVIEQYTYIEIVLPTCLTYWLSSVFFQLICIASLICNLKYEKARSIISKQ